MKKQRIIQIITLFSLIFVLFVTTGGEAIAATLSGIKDQIEDANKEHSAIQDDLKELLADIKKKKEELEKQSSAQAEINAQIKAEITEQEQQIAILEEIADQILNFQSEIDELTEEYNTKMDMLLNRMNVLYKYSQFDYLKLYAEAESIFDYASRARLFTKLLEQDKRTLEDLIQLKKDIDIKKAKAEILALDAEDTLAAIRSAIERLKANKEIIDEDLEKIQNTLDKLRDEEDLMEEESKRIEAEIKELEQQYEDLKLQYSNSNGVLLWPSDNTYRVASYYGMRLHPVYKVMKLHKGIDIAASKNTNILASADGTVTYVGNDSDGYGKYFIIYHGTDKDGVKISTLYAHCNKILVKKGDSVKRGDIVGLVGKTGCATGYHIHYEVRENNVPVDPFDGYFTKR
ncbi:MAG: peptidoglycan DD-metalloendopeptidase family protein [Clostridia bacterium]|nr:peptidoglycan DD-metalloendopeptidase family protein [Clostridia bacterium]